jgi:hypothetical protein
MPLAARALLEGLEGSRVTPRIFHPPSLRKAFATDEPYVQLVRNWLIRGIEAGIMKSWFNDNNKKIQAYLIASDGDNHDEFCHVARI